MSVAEYAFRARSDLRGIDRPRDVERRAPEVGRRLQRLADAVLGDVLRSILYAAYVGDPRSGVLDGGDLSAHHDFGTELPGDDARRFGAWRFPGARMVPDRPWHAVGALLGLDLPTMHLRLAQVITAMPPVRQVRPHVVSSILPPCANVFPTICVSRLSRPASTASLQRTSVRSSATAAAARSDKRPSVNEVSTSSSLKAGRRVASAKARLPAFSLSPFGKIGEIGKIGQIRKYTGNTGATCKTLGLRLSSVLRFSG